MLKCLSQKIQNIGNHTFNLIDCQSKSYILYFLLTPFCRQEIRTYVVQSFPEAPLTGSGEDGLVSSWPSEQLLVSSHCAAEVTPEAISTTTSSNNWVLLLDTYSGKIRQYYWQKKYVLKYIKSQGMSDPISKPEICSFWVLRKLSKGYIVLTFKIIVNLSNSLLCKTSNIKFHEMCSVLLQM